MKIRKILFFSKAISVSYSFSVSIKNHPCNSFVGTEGEAENQLNVAKRVFFFFSSCVHCSQPDTLCLQMWPSDVYMFTLLSNWYILCTGVTAVGSTWPAQTKSELADLRTRNESFNLKQEIQKNECLTLLCLQIKSQTLVKSWDPEVVISDALNLLKTSWMCFENIFIRLKPLSIYLVKTTIL